MNKFKVGDKVYYPAISKNIGKIVDKVDKSVIAEKLPSVFILRSLAFNRF